MSAKTLVHRDLLEDALGEADIWWGHADIRSDYRDGDDTCLALTMLSNAPFRFFTALAALDELTAMRMARAAKESATGGPEVIVYFPGFQLED